MYFFSLFSLSLFWEAFLHWFLWYISTNSMHFSCNFPYVVWPGSYPSSMNPFPLVLQMHFSIQSCIFMLHVVQAQIEVFSINHSKPEHSGLNPVNPGSNFRPVPVLTHDLSHLKYNIKFLSTLPFLGDSTAQVFGNLLTSRAGNKQTFLGQMDESILVHTFG